MAEQANSASWFIRDGSQERGPLAEPELRRQLFAKQGRDLWVRQGNSGWVDAETVRKKFTELAERGVYLRRHDQQTEGPYTASRAFEILQQIDRVGIETRVGRDAPWYPAERLYRKLASLAETKPALEAGRSRATSLSVEPIDGPIDAIPMAVIVEEPEIVDGILIEVTPRPIPQNRRRAAERSNATVVPALPGFPSSPVQRSGPTAAGVRRPTKKNGSLKWLLIIGGCAFLFFLLLAGGGLYMLYHWSANRGERTAAASEGGFPTGNEIKRSHRVPPPVRPGTLFRPTFHTRAGMVDAGTAFAARLDRSDQTLLFSALHLLGPAGGLPADIPPQQVPSSWQRLSLVDCLSGQEHTRVPGIPLLLAGTRPFPNASSVGDVIAFRHDGNQPFHSYDLATEPPRPGDPVWLVSEVIDNSQLVHPAHVVGEVDSWLAYEFVAPHIELRATSGAPILNASHQVIAVNAGGGSEGGRTVGLGTPVTKFRDSVKEALTRTQ